MIPDPAINSFFLNPFLETVYNDINRDVYPRVRKDMMEWLRENCTTHSFHIESAFASAPSYIMIEDDTEAMLFKLTWM